MTRTSLAFLKEQIELNDQLLAGREHMFNPQDLPGRYGRVVRAVDHLLQIIKCEAALGGGWAVWHHGFVARVTQDIDMVLPASRIDEFLRVAAVSGFNILPKQEGRWPKLIHKETGTKKLFQKWRLTITSSPFWIVGGALCLVLWCPTNYGK